MDSFITFLQDNPLYIIGLVLLIIFILFSLFKKAVKLLIIAIILFAGYSYFLNGSYQSSNNAFEVIENKVQELIN